jgi:hypothetical protein
MILRMQIADLRRKNQPSHPQNVGSLADFSLRVENFSVVFLTYCEPVGNCRGNKKGKSERMKDET